MIITLRISLTLSGWGAVRNPSNEYTKERSYLRRTVVERSTQHREGAAGCFVRLQKSWRKNSRRQMRRASSSVEPSLDFRVPFLMGKERQRWDGSCHALSRRQGRRCFSRPTSKAQLWKRLLI